MTPKALRFAALAAALALSVFATPAKATTVTFTSGDFTEAPFGVILSGSILGNNNPYDLGPWAGQMKLHGDDGSSILAWCVDLFHDLDVNSIGTSYGSTPSYTVGPLSTDSRGATQALSAQLSNQQIHDALALANYGNQQLAALSPGFQHDVLSGEVQIAIWSVIYAGSVSASTYLLGGVDTHSMTALDFQAGINNLVAIAPTLSIGSALAMQNIDGSGTITTQSLVGNFVSPFDLQAAEGQVPEPAPLALLGIGLMALLQRKGRR